MIKQDIAAINFGGRPGLESQPINPKNGSADRKKADEIRAEFEKKVGEAKTRAWYMAFMYTFLRNLDLGSLTWAVGVLLGLYLSHIARRDTILVGFVIALTSLRIFVIQTVTDILHKDRFRESSVPNEFKFLDKQKEEVNKMNNRGQGVSLVLSVSTAVCGFIGIIIHGISPHLFYILVFVVACFNILHAYLRNSPRGSYDASSKQNSLMCFYDEVYRTAIKVGLGEGSRLELLEFAFTKLASDFKRNIRPQLIQIQNKDLIRYMYHNQQGIAMVCEALKSSSNVWHQVVAANLPGFWVEEERIELQLGLFWALGERLHGSGKDAEGALNSIEQLALSFATNQKMKKQDFHPFLIKDPAIEAGRSCIVTRLVGLVCRRVRPTTLFQIRALEACCQSSQVVEYLHRGRRCRRRRRRRLNPYMTGVEAVVGDKKTDAQKLYAAFDKLLENDKVRAKGHIISAWVALLSRGQGTLGEDIPQDLVEIFKSAVQKYTDDLGHNNYIWLNEVLMAEGLRKILGMTENCPDWTRVLVRSNTDAEEVDVKSKVEEYLNNRFPPNIPLYERD